MIGLPKIVVLDEPSRRQIQTLEDFETAILDVLHDALLQPIQLAPRWVVDETVVQDGTTKTIERTRYQVDDLSDACRARIEAELRHGFESRAFVERGALRLVLRFAPPAGVTLDIFDAKTGEQLRTTAELWERRERS